MKAFSREVNGGVNKVILDGVGESVWIDAGGVTVHIFRGSGHTVVEAYHLPLTVDKRVIYRVDLSDPIKEAA